MKERIKQILFHLLGKDPDAIVVSFLSGPSEVAEKMAAEIRALEPTRRHFLVTNEHGSGLAIWWRLSRRFRKYRIGLAPVLFTNAHRGRRAPLYASSSKDAGYRSLRRAAFLLAPTRILAYNENLERHHLRLRTAIASILFMKGVALDRIHLRPKYLFPWKQDRSLIPDRHREWEGRPVTPGRPNIAILTPYAPWPLSHGGAVRVFYLLREMAREFDVSLLAFGEKETQADIAPLLEHCARVILVDKPHYREPRWSTLLPPEVHEYRSPAMQDALKRVREDARVVQVEYTALASYRGSILVEHDVTFDLYRQIWKRERTLAAWWDFWRWRRFERAVVRRFERVVLMSEKDRGLLGAANATVIPNGVDLERFQPEQEPATSRLLFVGSFRHFPNIVAFRFFFEEVWPPLRERLPHLEATVVTGPDPRLFWPQLPEIAGVRLLEFVADVKPLYAEANLVLVPTLVSAGTNIKVLEGLAMERAVLSTSSGCAGLNLEHGTNVWIADGPDKFRAGVMRLLEDAELRRRIAVAGRLHAERLFDWKAIGTIQRDLLEEVLGRRLGIRPAREEDLAAISAIQSTAPEAAQWKPLDYLMFSCHVAVRQGTVMGFVVSRQIARDEREILNVAVHPRFRRQGIARSLITAELERWPGQHFLEVRQSNAPARRLYHRLGFREVGVRPDYYDTPPEPGIVMRFFS